MNDVIKEFKKELSHKIHKSYEIFFFDPTADEFFWDTKEQELSKKYELSSDS